MSLRELCSRHVVTMPRGASLREAANTMRAEHVGDVVVVDDDNGARVPVGILTDRDIVVQVVAEGLDPDSVSVGDAMSYELRTVSADANLLETIELMRVEAIRRLPVVDETGDLMGILTVDDLIGLVAKEMTEIYALVLRERERETGRRT